MTRVVAVALFTVLVASFALLLSHSADAANEAFPFPQHVAYSAPHIKPSTFSQSVLDGHAKSFYDYWKAKYLKPAGTNANGKQMYRIYKDAGGTTVSEGQGYGMMITAYMAGYDTNAQALFDGLWYFVKQYPSQFNANNMKWSINPDGNPAYQDSAYDGDADITFGLLLAAKQWPTVVTIDYLSEAQARLGAMKATTGANSFMPMLGDWVNPSGSPHNERSPRISDFMYGHFQAYAAFHTGQQSFWQSVLSSTKTVLGQLQNDYAPATGLLPDFATYNSGTSKYQPAYAGFLEGGNDGNYNYNAGRIPWRLGVYSLNANDATAIQQTVKIASWVKTQSSIGAGYTLGGSQIAGYFTTFFASPFAVSAMLDTSAQAFLNSLYAQIYNRQENYYEDSVNMLCLIALTGNWWQPTNGGTPASPSATPSRSPAAPSPSSSPAGQSPSASASKTPSPSASASKSKSKSPSRSPGTQSPSSSKSKSASKSKSKSVSPSKSKTPSHTPSKSKSKSVSPSKSKTPSPSASPRSPSKTPSRSVTPSRSRSPAPPSASPTSFNWANDINAYFVAIAFTASNVAIDCGEGYQSMVVNNGWIINGSPVWVWEGHGFACSRVVSLQVDGAFYIGVNRPGST